MTEDSRVAKATIRDGEVLDGLDEAEEEHGSMAEAVRHALATTYAAGDGVDGDTDDTGLPVKAREGHRKLVEWTGIGGRIALDTAESILANHLNIQKDAVRKVIIKPLKAENAIRIHQGIHDVSIVVGTLGGERIGAKTTAEPTQAEPAMDGGEARERLDELAAAGEEASDA